MIDVLAWAGILILIIFFVGLCWRIVSFVFWFIINLISAILYWSGYLLGVLLARLAHQR